MGLGLGLEKLIPFVELRWGPLDAAWVPCPPTSALWIKIPQCHCVYRYVLKDGGFFLHTNQIAPEDLISEPEWYGVFADEDRKELICAVGL